MPAHERGTAGFTVSYRSVELFNDSLARCLSDSHFFQRFLDLFLASSDEVRKKFQFTDIARQKRSLQQALYMLVEHLAMPSRESLAYLERISAEHGRHGLDIRPELYDLWLDCLLRAVRECDKRWTSEVDAAWRYVMQSGITFLKSRYDQPPSLP